MGEKGLDMMFRTAASQVSLDFSSEADMVSKLRLSLALQPLATALFANSPFLDGKPTGWLSTRTACWQDTDPHRTGVLPFAFEPGMGFERYVDWALDVPMYCVYRDNPLLDAPFYDVAGASFSDFLVGKLPGLEGQYPTENDWNDHLTTLFPEVRLKHVLEMRGADAGPFPMICALPAFWTGLLYDSQSQDAAWEHVRFWTAEERAACYRDAPRTGLHTPIPGGTLHQLARSIVDIATHGLKRRGFSEETFLDPLRQILDTGRSQAEELLILYQSSWQGSVMPAFSTCVHA
jgi:glutamate--cysteine ligase